MALEPVVIPDKIYFKIGEVCDLVGVQAHVLRYWETEFSMLSPQKNKSGQRSYRRKDVEIALRIKQLLYNEMFTIAGAKKKLQSEAREGAKPKEAVAKPQPPASTAADVRVEAPTLFDAVFESEQDPAAEPPDRSRSYSDGETNALKAVAVQLLELREMLKRSPAK